MGLARFAVEAELVDDLLELIAAEEGLLDGGDAASRSLPTVAETNFSGIFWVSTTTTVSAR